MENRDPKDWQLDEKTYHCRFHPTDWFHEVGCPHMKWSEEDLKSAAETREKGKQLAGKTLDPELFKEVYGHYP